MTTKLFMPYAQYERLWYDLVGDDAAANVTLVSSSSVNEYTITKMQKDELDLFGISADEELLLKSHARVTFSGVQEELPFSDFSTDMDYHEVTDYE